MPLGVNLRSKRDPNFDDSHHSEHDGSEADECDGDEENDQTWVPQPFVKQADHSVPA